MPMTVAAQYGDALSSEKCCDENEELIRLRAYKRGSDPWLIYLCL